MRGRICIFISIVLLLLAVFIPRLSGGTGFVARKVERIASERLAVLEKSVAKMLAENPYEWTEVKGLPEDMIIYRYVNDSLQCWVNQFSVLNDDISRKRVVQRLTNPRITVDSPLASVGDTIGFYNFGPKWYLAKSVRQGKVCIIYGIAVQNSLDNRSFSGVNPNFHIGDKYSFQPLSSEEGSVVDISGKPVFRVRSDTLNADVEVDDILVWLALAFFVAGLLLTLAGRRTIRQFQYVSAGMVLSVSALYINGQSAQEGFGLFSPALYADGPVFYSLGAVVCINLVITLLSFGLLVIRKDVFDRIKGRETKIAATTAVLAACAGIVAYTHFSIRSIVLNSNISLELYKYETLSQYTAIVYVSFLAVLLSIPMLLTLLMPIVRLNFGHKFNPLSTKSRIVFSICASVYMVLVSAIFGFTKEQERTEVWVPGIVFDRDASLEITLCQVESQIASDPIIASLSLISDGKASIINRLSDTYFGRIIQSYDVDLIEAEEFMKMLQNGESLSEESNFIYVGGDAGHPVYAGMFQYFIPGYGLCYVALKMEPRTERNVKKLVSMPPFYSYARYEGGNLVLFNGRYAYPMKMVLRPGHFNYGGYTHFVSQVSQEESVIISRPDISPVNYLVAAVFLSLFAYIVESLLCVEERRRKSYSRWYYRTRINSVVMVSLTLTLLVMTAVSVVFVYRRNDINLRGIMYDKINGIQSLLSDRMRNLQATYELQSQEMISLLETAALSNDADITLYSPEGVRMITTSSSAAENLKMGTRMDGEAYNTIMKRGDRYCVKQQGEKPVKYYGLYAPLRNTDGDILAIISVPYLVESLDFGRDAVSHLATILTAFLLLLLSARFITSTIVDRMLKPINEMRRRMSQAGHDSLQKLDYDREDEISSLVSSYNGMVDELERSSRELAQAERDKAWSGMARQVAHEIKNPLTPMKLQLQRIMRLKEKNDPSWQDKFDEMTAVLLDHINILTDTANEFSTFAKLYTEEPAVIELDKLLQEEIAMFDNKGPLTFEYFGLEGTRISGPKPQLTRVFVNIINNSVQALDGMEGGIIRVALRNSTQDGYYDIVFEDNGPGVSDDNLDRLFTPNFTTKNGGSGLGLAISRSILERCDASISYSRSFALGGACFTIRYPK